MMHATSRTLPQRSKARAFTLIEIIVVISIIVILAGVLMLGLSSAFSSGDDSEAKTQIANIEGALSRYETRQGGVYPPSSLRKLSNWKMAPPNTENDGIESLVLALRTGFDGGPFLLDDSFNAMRINADQDMNPDSSFLNAQDCVELYELADPWDNPYVYVNADELDASNGYASAGGMIQVRTADGELHEVDLTLLKAAIAESEGGLSGKRYLLWSFGANGVNDYGNEDDICNWK